MDVKPGHTFITADIIDARADVSPVRAEAPFSVTVQIAYEADEPVDLPVFIATRDDPDTRIMGNRFSPFFEGVIVESTGDVVLWLFARPSSDGTYPYTWELLAILEGYGTFDFDVEVVAPESDPYMRITGVEATSEGEDRVYVGSYTEIVVHYEYSLPIGSHYDLYIKSPSYPEPIWAGGNDISGTGIGTDVGYEYAPLVSELPWVLEFMYEYTTPGDDEVRETEWYSVSIEVFHHDDIWEEILFVACSGSVPPGEEFPANIRVLYDFPEEEGDVEIGLRIQKRDGSRIEGGDERRFSYSGSGSFLETFSLQAPEVEGLLELRAELRIFEGPISELKDFETMIGGEGAEQYCRIDNIAVITEDGRFEPPAVPDVTFDSPFDVEITISWDLDVIDDRIPGIIVFIEDASYFLGILSGDGLEVLDDGEGEETFTILVSGDHIPPINGPWNLIAYAFALDIWGMTIVSEFRDFQVNVVGAEEGIVGGVSDWAINTAWVTPVDPFMGGDMTSTAIIVVDTEEALPQRVEMAFSLDEMEPERGWINYEGGDFLAVTSSPWTPTLGTHTIRWEVDPDEDYIDDNRDNNVFELSFTVSEMPPLPPGWEPPAEEEGEPEIEEEFDFYITATPNEQVLASSISYTVTVEHVSGPPNPVQIEVEGVPASVSYMVDPASGNPSYSAELTLTAASSLPAGTYHLIIKAVGDEKERYKTVIFTVEEGPSYQLKAQPRILHATPGETVEYSLTVSSENGYSQYVNLMISGLPQGVTSRLEPSADKPDFQSILNLDVGEEVNPGTYSFTVSGSGAEPKRVTLTLFVKEAATQQPEEAGEQGKPLTYYLPLLYLIAIIAVIVAGSWLAVRYVRGRPSKSKSFCIECGKKIPVGTEFCPKCGAKQKE